MSVLSLEIASACDDQCPNEKATHVPANDVGVGIVTHCSVHLSLFGLEIEIEGPECASTLYHFPAHGWCNNAANPDTKCVQKGILQATVEHCQCGVSLFGVHVLLPICTCTDSNSTIPCTDAGTAPCPVSY
jgi:hypothetical protein